jgi:hypothetical protein
VLAYVAFEGWLEPTLPIGHPASEIFTGGTVRAVVAVRQRLVGEKEPFVA